MIVGALAIIGFAFVWELFWLGLGVLLADPPEPKKTKAQMDTDAIKWEADMQRQWEKLGLECRKRHGRG